MAVIRISNQLTCTENVCISRWDLQSIFIPQVFFKVKITKVILHLGFMSREKIYFSFQPFICITKRRLNFVHFISFYGLFFAVLLLTYLKTFSCAYFCAQQYGAEKCNYTPPLLNLLKINFSMLFQTNMCTCSVRGISKRNVSDCKGL